MKKAENKSFFAFGHAVLLFAAVPLFIFSFTVAQSLGRFSELDEKARLMKMEKELDQFVSKTYSGSYIIKLVRDFLIKMKKKGYDSDSLVKFRKSILKRYGVPISAYIFQKGKLLRVIPETSSQKEFIKAFYSSLFFEGKDSVEAHFRIKDQISKLLGPGMRPEVFNKYPRSLYKYNIQNANRFFYWTYSPDGFGVFIVVTNEPDIIKRAKAYLKPFQKGYGVGIIDSKERNIRFLPPPGISSDTMQIAWQKSKLQGSDLVEFGGKTWLFVANKQGEIFCRVLEGDLKEGVTIYQVSVFVGYFLCGLLVIILVLAVFQVSFAVKLVGWLETTSIKFRLAWLFGTASLVPLALALLFGGLEVNDRGEILREENCRQALDRLSSLENSYLSGYEKFKRICNFFRNVNWLNFPKLEVLTKVVNRLVKNEEIQRLDLRGVDGEIFYTTDDTRVHGAAMATTVFSRMAVKRHSPGRLPIGKLGISPEEVVSESILNSDEVGLSTVIGRRNQIWRFQPGCGTTALWYWDVFPEFATGPAFIALAHQMDRVLCNGIQRKIRSQPQDDRNFQAVLEIDAWHPRLEFYPKLYGNGSRELKAAAIRSFLSNKFLSRDIEINGKSYLVTMRADEGQGVGFFILIDLIRGDYVLRELGPLTRRILLGMLFAILISLIAAFSLSALFVNPIADLEIGINAIRNRVSDARIPIRRKDEFGNLAGVFNKLLSEMNELRYAAYVQESLLPSSLTPVEGWKLFFLRRSATDLAGDYHDVFELEKGKLGVIVGDVTGHGISAALAMAMAKATVSFGKINSWKFPTEYLDRLNSLFYRELKPRAKFMTLGAACVDLKSGEVILENSGHPYSLWFSCSKGNVQECDLPSFPLGSRIKRIQRQKLISMEPGDGLLMFTDGFPECFSKSGELLGYQKLKELFREKMLSGIGHETILDSMNLFLDSFRKPGPLPDDVTLVLLVRE
ncbi:MAG: SpoIIE family protein phosphatase [Candidatus Riflebacteria bacterium]|nr:SpoIIE family protein phosphatase [Candidatus Riflebacteria bacterium]